MKYIGGTLYILVPENNTLISFHIDITFLCHYSCVFLNSNSVVFGTSGITAVSNIIISLWFMTQDHMYFIKTSYLVKGCIRF